MANETGCNISKLQGGDDYHAWKFSMRMFLLGRDLWEIVEGSETVNEHATELEQRKFKRRENHALANICLSIVPSLHIYVRSCKTAKEAWDNLERRFEEKSLTRKIEYRRKLYAVKFSDGMSMIEHVNELKTIAERLESLGDPVSEKDLVMILISSLSDAYNNLITSLESVKEEELSWEYVRDRAISEYERRKHADKDNHTDDALYVGRGDKTFNQGRGRDQINVHHYQNKDEIECYYCKKPGHYKSDCPKLEKKNAANFVKQIDDLSIAEKEESYITPEFALHVVDNGRNESSWIVDSGCSKHMSNVVSDFVEYKKFCSPLDVLLADKSVSKAVGIGSVKVLIRNARDEDVCVEFRNVLYVPLLTKRLVSISQMTQKGAEITFKKDSCELYFHNMKFRLGQRVDNTRVSSLDSAV